MSETIGNAGPMDALGIPPTLAKPARPRKAPEFLPAYNDILFFWDILAGVLLGYASACVLGRYVSGDAPLVSFHGPLLREVILGSIIAALVLRDARLTDALELRVPTQLLARLILRAVAAVLILITVCLMTRGLADFTRIWVISWCGAYLVCVCISRILVITYLYHLAAQGVLREAVAVIGAPDVAGRLATCLAENAAVVKVIDDVDSGVPASEAVVELIELVRSGEVDTVVVALDAHERIDARPLIRHLKSLPVQVTLCSDVDAPTTTQRTLRLMGNVPMSVIADRPLTRWDLLAKAALDKVGATLLLLACAPVMIVIAIAIILESPGPLIFRQRRSGWGGRLFTIYKFRTMRHEIGATTAHQTKRNDPRRTRVGAFLRRTSLDELPQLWNVLRGEMSLVGPRPHADMLHESERFGCTVVAEYAQRHRMRPGLTGWAQIHGSRGAVSSQEALRRRIAYDLYYIDNWSMALDLLILARTPWVLLTGENAY